MQATPVQRIAVDKKPKLSGATKFATRGFGLFYLPLLLRVFKFTYAYAYSDIDKSHHLVFKRYYMMVEYIHINYPLTDCTS